jgi:hypothetical protein
MSNSKTPLSQENSVRQMSGSVPLNSVALGVGETYNNAAKDHTDSLRQLCLKFALKVWTFLFCNISIGEIWATISTLAANTKEVKYSTSIDPHGNPFSYRT